MHVLKIQYNLWFNVILIWFVLTTTRLVLLIIKLLLFTNHSNQTSFHKRYQNNIGIYLGLISDWCRLKSVWFQSNFRLLSVGHLMVYIFFWASWDRDDGIFHICLLFNAYYHLQKPWLREKFKIWTPYCTHSSFIFWHFYHEIGNKGIPKYARRESKFYTSSFSLSHSQTIFHCRCWFHCSVCKTSTWIFFIKFHMKT